MSSLEAIDAEQSVEKLSPETRTHVELAEKDVEVKKTSEKDLLPWNTGDVVWAKIPGHPWWPSLITFEPNTTIYYKMKGRARYYHVQFYGTDMLRGWVTERNVIKYEGKSHFLSLNLSIHGIKLFKIANKQLPLWENAIKKADEVYSLTSQERLDSFNTLKLNVNCAAKPENKDKPSLSIDQQLNGDTFQTSIKDDKICDKTVQTATTTMPSKKLKTTKSIEKSRKKVKSIENKNHKKVVKGAQKNFTQIFDNDSKDKDHKCTVNNDNSNKTTPTRRKRGRPPKDPNHAANCINSLPKKPKIASPKQNGFLPKLNSSFADSERSETGSDCNSFLSMDMTSFEEPKRLSLKAWKLKEGVCAVCEKPDDLIICEGVCKETYHKACLWSTDYIPEKLICEKCTTGNHVCFVCGKTNDLVKCSFLHCNKFYHVECLQKYDVKIDNNNVFECPLHHCNVCGINKTKNKRRLTQCTRCPVAYHSATCIVAGSLPITSQYIVCHRHFTADPKKAHHTHVNVNWCFVCSIGGELICCERCPAAFHPECIQEKGIPEGDFYCRDCRTGKELLYGEVVWVKFGLYRWWPAQICHPNFIPNNIQRMKHQPGEFPVEFLGSHDYHWIHRGRVFSYQEGDKGSVGTGGKYLGEIFKRALVEAHERYVEWEKIQEEKAERDLEKLSKKPAAYKHIKVNRYTTASRYDIEESEWTSCDCNINDEDPCGPNSHCLNRILYVECSPLKCPAKEKCQNQCFVKRQYLDCEPFRAPKRGWGLKAKEDATKGQFVIEYVGELINEETCRERVRKGISDGVMNYYMLTIDKDCIIDAGPMGNFSRFMNHSCDPNCETQKWTVNGEVRVGLFAKRDIKAGEELVFDYQLDCLGNEKKRCCCGSDNCSGFLGVRPKTQHALKLLEEKKKNQDSKKSQDSKKKKKKTASKKNIDEHEDECFDCGDGGELIMCSKTGCSKCYHLSCLTIDKIPHGDWICPWHFCDDCGKAATIRCHECSNSFCHVHALGQIHKLPNGHYLCNQHFMESKTAVNEVLEDKLLPSADFSSTKDEPETSSSVLSKNADASSHPNTSFGENLHSSQISARANPISETIDPLVNPVVPTIDPDVPTIDPVVPTIDHVIPTIDPVIPTIDPVIPTNDSVIPTKDSVIPTKDSVIPTKDPFIPTKDPFIPTIGLVIPSTTAIESNNVCKSINDILDGFPEANATMNAIPSCDKLNTILSTTVNLDPISEPTYPTTTISSVNDEPV